MQRMPVSVSQQLFGWHSSLTVLPFRASGAFTAIEDAEAVGAYLEGVSRAEVPDALDRIFRGRFRRATSFQKASRAWTEGGEQQNGEHADLKEESALFEEWNYPGVKAWIGQHPEMMLKQTK
jgi:2-polyprenyl-6-methoxyphenol hydroxylase-like FAD-dependent oxidoreductase